MSSESISYCCLSVRNFSTLLYGDLVIFIAVVIVALFTMLLKLLKVSFGKHFFLGSSLVMGKRKLIVLQWVIGGQEEMEHWEILRGGVVIRMEESKVELIF